MSVAKPNPLIKRILKLNPTLSARITKNSHWCIYKGEKLIAILPNTFKSEGLANNTKTLFKREGVKW